MRDFLTLPCAGTTLAATIDLPADPAPAAVALLIVSGGTEIRSGAHGGMAQLAARIADAGWPVLRYDRRGVGDSGGDDPGFADSAPDLAAAASALRLRLPAGGKVIGFGLCDGATTLALHHQAAGIDGLLLGNPWVVEPAPDLPPPAAIRAHYARRLLDWRFWKRALTGGVDLRRAARGVAALTATADTSLTDRVGGALATGDRPLGVLLAKGDATAIAFDAAWRTAAFADVRDAGHAEVIRIDSTSHSFAGDDALTLAAFVMAGLTAY